MQKLVAALAEAGVPLLTGTDAPFSAALPGVSLHEELRLLIGSGLSPYATLHAATASAARCLGHDREFGIVRPGARADLLVLENDPLFDLATLAHPRDVILRGRWLASEQLKRIVR